MPELPQCAASYLVRFLFDAGPTVPGGMSAAPLPYSEIEAWTNLTGIALRPWEARALRVLSMDYVEQCVKSEKPDCPPPYVAPLRIDDTADERRAAVKKKLDEIFG